MVRLLSGDRAARLDNQVASTAPNSRGATSLPSGDPNPTVTICSRSCATVVRNGIRGPFAPTALLMETRELPNRYTAHQPVPATTPQTDSTTNRRTGDDAPTPCRKLSRLTMVCLL